MCCCPQQAELLQQLQRELEALREQFRRQQDSTQARGEGGGERGVMRKKGKFHWCSLTVFIVSVLPSLQHDFEAALAAKDAIIEQLRRDLQEMQAKLDVSEGVGVDVSGGVGWV